MITVLRAGPLTTVQDLGRPGFAHLGVPRSGALDQPALRRANTLVGNDPSVAGLETTLLGCRLRVETATRIAVTGATCAVRIDGATVTGPGPFEVPAGAVVDIGRAVAGVRSYVAVAGGIAVDPVLGSRSTDLLSGLGPPRLTDGQTIATGIPRHLPTNPQSPFRYGVRALPQAGDQAATGAATAADGATAAAGAAASDAHAHAGAGPRRAVGGPGRSARGVEADRAAAAEIVLGVWTGPRADWVEVAELFTGAYEVSPMSNRVACRLAGTPLRRTRAGELPPEGLVLGAVQVPPDGQPLVFLADHPTTGGYPVAAVVDDVTPLAQARPGTTVRFRELR